MSVFRSTTILDSLRNRLKATRESKRMKTVIHVWTHDICNYVVTPLYARFGLGDSLRGAIGVLQYCEKRGYQCIIDTSLHPLSQLLVSPVHPYSDLIQANKGNIKGIFSEVEQFIESELQNEDVVFFFSNFGLSVYDQPPTPFVLSAIQKVLTFQPAFAAYVDAKIHSVPYTPFSVVHFRLGDGDLICGETSSQHDRYIKMLEAVSEPGQILLSDSSRFKDSVKGSVFTFDEPVSHVGYHTEREGLQHTLFEFILVTRAKHIRTFSIYGWTSGFVKSASYIFGVPLTAIDQ